MKLDNQQPSYLKWLGGFFDGDGSICYSSNRIVISFHNTNQEVILGIKNFLDEKGIKNIFLIDERIKKHKPVFSVIVRTKEDTNKLGKMLYRVTLTKKNKIKQLLKIEGSETKDLPLSDEWVSGFIDAEGCFTFGVYTTRKKKLSITPTSIVTTTDKPTAQAIHSYFIANSIPVWFETLDKKKLNRKIVYRLNTKGIKRIVTMEKFLPMLKIKNLQLQNLIDYSKSRLSKNRLNKFTDEELNFVRLNKSLNKLGR